MRTRELPQEVEKVFPVCSLFLRKRGQRERSPDTENSAPQTTAIYGSGERQPPRVQWMASARGSLLCYQGIPTVPETELYKFAKRALEAIPPGIPLLRNPLHAYKGTSARGRKVFRGCVLFFCEKRDSANAVPIPKIAHPKQPLFTEVANVSHPECNGWPQLGKPPL
ncbi:hypothetical protein TNIN_441021 [Trichonephila inaurata madagascariensis]|uniref:Uncharacterized protein n=1 Tax=Trichonephila inaurata madagascariensis TaxID=2747483 RepID=A0A8X6X8J0_9ARAC|nr:hypothetical protein TNIN_441021 [Trichonephila inaurata madagascariensis]